MKTRELIAHLTLADPSGEMLCVSPIAPGADLMGDAVPNEDIRKGLVRRSRFGAHQYVERDPALPIMLGDAESLEVIIVGQ